MSNPKFLAIIGWPVAHSRSPLIHNYWLQRAGLNVIYKPYPIKPDTDFAAVLATMAQQGFIGANVTVPHKETAFAAMTQCQAAAAQLQAVNTIIFTKNGTQGANTDGTGFVAGLDEHDTKWRNAPALVLGAGGAARAVVAALAQAGVHDIRLVNRNRDKAESVAKIGQNFGDLEAKIALFDWHEIEKASHDAGLLVNATYLGMVGKPLLPDMPLTALRPNALVNDLVYTPRLTPLLRHAQQVGLRPIDGLGMLLHQAAASFALWFGQLPPVSATLRARLLADLGE